MAVLNVTPDSFYDGGQLYTPGSATAALDLVLARVEAQLAAGADIIDIGGESTRPGAAEVSSQQEIDRVLPLVEALHARFDVPLSIDTSNAQLMTEAAAAGAALINDVRALSREGALQAAAETGLHVCLMHMQGQPATMQQRPVYSNVVDELQQWFKERMAICEAAGINRDKLILDPGIGFGKSDEHNLALLRATADFVALGCPVLIGVSRKSMLGRLLGRPPEQRLAGSLALAYDVLMRGAKVLRVHDVEETADLIRLFNLLHRA